MTRLFVVFLCAGMFASTGCSSSPDDNSNSSSENSTAQNGKSDEFNSDQNACTESGGSWTDDSSDAYYCACPPDETFVSGAGCTSRVDVQQTCEGTGGTFEAGEDYAFCQCPDGRYIDHGNCLAPDPEEEAACLDTGGTWTDDASDSYYCACAPEEIFVRDAGCADREEVGDLCQATGGTYQQGEGYAYCECPDGRTLDHGNCLASDPQEEARCRTTGGIWTDDSSDSYYCVCADDETFVREEGCVSRQEVQNVCEATGGMFREGEDWAYCECSDGRTLDDGNCLAPNPEHEQACLESGGTWTDDASDSYYCVCADGAEIYDGTPCE